MNIPKGLETETLVPVQDSPKNEMKEHISNYVLGMRQSRTWRGEYCRAYLD